MPRSYTWEITEIKENYQVKTVLISRKKSRIWRTEKKTSARAQQKVMEFRAWQTIYSRVTLNLDKLIPSRAPCFSMCECKSAISNNFIFCLQTKSRRRLDFDWNTFRLTEVFFLATGHNNWTSERVCWNEKLVNAVGKLLRFHLFFDFTNWVIKFRNESTVHWHLPLPALDTLWLWWRG